MEDKSSATQNKIGELFVDIGSSGLGQLVKGLNSVSASFLLAKKGATEFTKPIMDVIKGAVNGAREWEKLSSTLGASIEQIQSLTYALRKYKIDENGIFNNIGQLQSKFYDITHGLAGIDTNTAYMLNSIGKSVNDYTGDINSVLQYIEDIENYTKEKKLNAVDRKAMFEKGGVNTELMYAFDKGLDLKKEANRVLTKDELASITQMGEETEELKNEIEKLKNKGTAKVAPVATDVLRNANGVFDENKNVRNKSVVNLANPKLKDEEFVKSVKNDSTFLQAQKALLQPLQFDILDPKKSNSIYGLFKNFVQAKAQTTEATSSQLKPIATPKQQQAYDEENITPEMLKIDYSKIKGSGAPTGFAAPIPTMANIQSDNPLDRAGIPSSEQNKIINNNVNSNVTNNFKISSTDPERAAQEAINKFNEHDMALKFLQTYDYY